MNASDTFKCNKMKISMYVGKCIRNQKEALAFWGPEAGRFQSCPCDQGVKIKEMMEGNMAKKGTCNNCLREDMTIHSFGMCGGCVGRMKGLEGEDRDNALAKAKGDFLGKGSLVHKRGEAVRAKVRRIRQSENVKAVSGADSTRKEKQNHGSSAYEAAPNLSAEGPARWIQIVFHDTDQALFDGIKDLSKKFRRNPDQQILWMIQQELEYQDGIKARFHDPLGGG